MKDYTTDESTVTLEDADAEEVSALLGYKLQLERAEEHGLADDPTAAALREHVAEREAALQNSPQGSLAETAGVAEQRVAHLSDEDAERAETLVEAVEIARGGDSAALQNSAEDRYAELEELLDDGDVSAAALADPIDDERQVRASDLLEGE